MSGAFVTGYDGELYGPCMCERCRRLYKEKTGQDAPALGMRDPGFMRYVGFQSKRGAVNKARQYRFIKQLDPELAVNGFDYMRTECNTDIGRGAWVYASSANARSGGRMLLVNNACVDFVGFRYRDTSVSPALTELRLCGKKTVLLGDIRGLSAEQAALLDGFARGGGTVLATGDAGVAADPRSSALMCLDITAPGERQGGLMSSVLKVSGADKGVFKRSAASPMIALGGDFRAASFAEGTKGYLRLAPEHPYDPPERCYPVPAGEQPGVTVHCYGAGQGIYLPALLGSLYYKEGWQNTLNAMQDILFGLCAEAEPAPGLSPMVELTLSRKEGLTVIQLVNESGCFANHYFPPTPMFDIALRLPGAEDKTARALRGGEVSCRAQNGDLLIHLDRLEEYEAVLVE